MSAMDSRPIRKAMSPSNVRLGSWIIRKELSDADGHQQITGHAFVAAGISTSQHDPAACFG